MEVCGTSKPTPTGAPLEATPESLTGGRGGGEEAVSVETGFPGSAEKNSFASRAMVAGSGNAAIASDKLSGSEELAFPSGTGSSGLLARPLVFEILVDIHVFQHTERIFSEHSRRAIQRNQVGGDRFMIDSHEENGEAGLHFARQAWLE
jgi:hypothetical protein